MCGFEAELNHSEKIWAYMKQFYKNKVFGNIENVKIWLANFIKNRLTSEVIQSITHDKLFLDAYDRCFAS